MKNLGDIIEVLGTLDERFNNKSDKQVANDNVERDMEQHRAFNKRLVALENAKVDVPKAAHGWQCPCCGTVYAIWVRSCACSVVRKPLPRYVWGG